jgi:hypothetical protein
MTTEKHKKTENNWPPGSPNRGPGVTMFITTVPTVLGTVITFIKKRVSFNKLKTTIKKKIGVLIGWIFDLGASTSWNPQGLSRPVMGLLYLYLRIYLEILRKITKSINLYSESLEPSTCPKLD